MNSTPKNIPVKDCNTVELKRFEDPRLGWISNIDKGQKQVIVDYHGNPLNRPLPALLGKKISLKELENVLDDIKAVKLSFFGEDPGVPVIEDIYYSLFDRNKAPSKMQNETLHVCADTLILEGKTKVIIRSGDAESVYDAESGTLTEEAEDIKSSARNRNLVRGGNVLLN